MKSLILLISLSSIGLAQFTVGVTVTNTQATFSYVAPSSSPCTPIKVSQTPLTPTYIPVNDVNGTLFPGSDSDARSYALSSGTSRIFVVGTRDVELASDSNYYSRALQAYTLHYYSITCGVSVATGTFTTMNVPIGDTRNDFILPRASDNTWQIPTITNVRNQQIIDPQTGVLLQDATIPSDAAGVSGLNLSDGAFTRMCADTLFTSSTGELGWFCGFFNDSGGSTLFFQVQATGEWRILGSPSVGYPALPDENGDIWFYSTSLSPNGIYKERYNGTFQSGSLSFATPVLSNQYGLSSALATFDSNFVPANFNDGSVHIYPNRYTSTFLTAVGSTQPNPGWFVVVYGDGGGVFNPSCTTSPCPRIVAAWWLSNPGAAIGDASSCALHESVQPQNSDYLIEANISGGAMCPYGGFASVVFWNFRSDPHGAAIIQNPTAFNFGGHLDFGATGSAPNGPTNGMIQEGGNAYQTVLGYPLQSVINSSVSPVNIIDANQPFAGATSPAAYSGVKHPSWPADGTFSSSNNAQTFWDAVPFGGGGNACGGNIIGCGTLVSGQLYKYTATQPINRKQQDTLATSQAQAYVDISGPSSSICNTSSCAGQYCIANVVNECVSGSSIGDIYINPISTTSLQPFCYGGEVPNISYPSMCIANNTMYATAVTQYWGTGTTEASSKSRVITKALALGPAFQPAYATAKPMPDSSWTLFAVGLNNSFSPSNIWAAKIPPYPTPDGVDRTTFIPGNVSITTPGGHGIASADVEFWYNEYGSGHNCTSRDETCLATASTV